MSDVMKNLGENLARIRMERGLSRKEISVLLGISEIELEDIEEGRGDVDVEFIYSIARILKMGIEDFLHSSRSKDKLLEQIKSKLAICSESELVSVFEYISLILKK